jgi:hypothetical protein
MALKHPSALSEREWDSLMDKLNTPPTKEQKKMITEAKESGRQIKTNT